MNFIIEPLVENHVENIYNFECNKLRQSGLDESEIMLSSWSSRWRKEQIQFYTQTGWSYVVMQNNEVVGYFLAQPLMFFEGLTQSLWIDHINFNNKEIADELMQTAWRLCRDKNFQRMYMPQDEIKDLDLSIYKIESWKNQISILNHPRMVI